MASIRSTSFSRLSLCRSACLQAIPARMAHLHHRINHLLHRIFPTYCRPITKKNLDPGRGPVSTSTLLDGGPEGLAMQANLDPVELAHAIAEIACGTQEHETARRLMELVDHLLAVAGLPPQKQETPPTP